MLKSFPINQAEPLKNQELFTAGLSDSTLSSQYRNLLRKSLNKHMDGI